MKSFFSSFQENKKREKHRCANFINSFYDIMKCRRIEDFSVDEAMDITAVKNSSVFVSRLSFLCHRLSLSIMFQLTNYLSLLKLNMNSHILLLRPSSAPVIKNYCLMIYPRVWGFSSEEMSGPAWMGVSRNGTATVSGNEMGRLCVTTGVRQR